MLLGWRVRVCGVECVNEVKVKEKKKREMSSGRTEDMLSYGINENRIRYISGPKHCLTGFTGKGIGRGFGVVFPTVIHQMKSNHQKQRNNITIQIIRGVKN